MVKEVAKLMGTMMIAFLETMTATMTMTMMMMGLRNPSSMAITKAMTMIALEMMVTRVTIATRVTVSGIMADMAGRRCMAAAKEVILVVKMPTVASPPRRQS